MVYFNLHYKLKARVGQVAITRTDPISEATVATITSFDLTKGSYVRRVRSSGCVPNHIGRYKLKYFISIKSRNEFETYFCLVEHAILP